MFGFRSKEAKANETLLIYAAQGDGFRHSLSSHIRGNKGHINLNVRNEAGDTALLLAIAAKGIGNVRVLIGNGADINLADKQGNTPLMKSIAQGAFGVAREFILANADVELANAAGDTAANFASKSTVKEILALVPYLKKEKSVDELKAQMQREDADRRVIEAVKQQDIKVLGYAVQSGGSVNAADSDGNSALMWAATHNSKAGIEKLVSLGAYVDYQNIPGKDYSALIVAAVRGNDTAAKALLDAGAKTELKTEAGKTAFDMALMSGHPSSAVVIAEAELARATTDDAKAAANVHKATAELVLGLQENNPFLAHDAIKRGAKIDVEVTNGYSLLTRAAQSGDNETLAILVAAGANIDQPDAKGRVPVVVAAVAGNGLAVRELVRLGVNVNQQDKDGETALGRMLIHDDRKTMFALIDAKADPNLRSAHHYTMLETIARWEGHGDVIARLGAAKADLDRVNDQGVTPLMIAIQAGWKDNAIAFIAAGANVAAVSRKGETILDLVHKAGWEDVAEQIAPAAAAAEAATTAKMPLQLPANDTQKPAQTLAAPVTQTQKPVA